MNRVRPLTWLFTVVLFSLSGVLTGSLLDRTLWEISFDFVYRPSQFAVGGARLGLFLGTITAFAATAGRYAPAGPGAIIKLGSATLFLGVILGLGAGTSAVLVSKSLVAQPESVSLAPRARVWFCEWLWMGTGAGAVFATVAGNYRLIRYRLVNQRNP